MFVYGGVALIQNGVSVEWSIGTCAKNDGITSRRLNFSLMLASRVARPKYNIKLSFYKVKD